MAKVLKDGSKICQAFQHGQCKSKPPCTQGQHRCGLVVTKERVCGASGHGASTSCKTAPRGPRGRGGSSLRGIPISPSDRGFDVWTNSPSKAFLFCGWQCLPVDWLQDPSHDLSHPLRQTSLAEQLAHVDFICAAMDCIVPNPGRGRSLGFLMMVDLHQDLSVLLNFLKGYPTCHHRNRPGLILTIGPLPSSLTRFKAMRNVVADRSGRTLGAVCIGTFLRSSR